MKIRHLIGLFLIPFLISIAGAVSLDILYWDEIVAVEQLEKPILFVIEIDPEGGTIEYGKLTLYITDIVNEEIYCKEELITSNLNETKRFNLTILPSACYKSLEVGTYKVKVIYEGYLENGTTFKNEVSKNLYIVDKLKYKGIDIEILQVSPDFEKLNKVSRGIWVIKVWVLNKGEETLSNVRAIVKVYDKYNTLYIKEESVSKEIEPGEKEEFRVSVDLSDLKANREYRIEIIVGNKDVQVRKEYNVTVIEGKLDEISVLDIIQYPFEVYPGDYVMLKLKIKNNLEKDIKVVPIVIARDFGIYKELDEIELEKEEIENVNVVLKIPEDISRGEYTITFRFETEDGEVYTKEYKIKIEGTENLLELRISYANIFVGSKNKILLEIRNLKEKLWNLEINANYDKGDIILETKEITLGGKGDRKEVELYIIPKEEGVGNLVIELIDKETGNIVIKKTFEIEAEVKKIELLKLENIKYIIAAIIAIAVAIAFWKLYRERAEEKPAR